MPTAWLSRSNGWPSTRGAVWDKAVVYCRQAGTRALARMANREAETCFTQALEALQHLPEQRHTLEQAIDLRLDLVHALIRLGDHGQTLILLREAETLAHTLDDRRRLGLLSGFIAYHYTFIGEYHQAVASAQQTLASAEALGDFTLQVRGNYDLSLAYHGLGDYRRAIDFLRSNVASLHGEGLHGSFGTPGLLAVASRSVLVRCLTELGAFAEAIALGEEAVQIAERANDLDILANACRSAPVPYLRKGDLTKAIPLLERGLGLCQAEIGLRFFAELAAALGAAYALVEHTDEALPLLEQAMVPSVLQQSFQSAAPFLWVSEAYLRLGRVEDASQCAERALAHARAHHARGHQARALWLLAEIATYRTPPQGKPIEAVYHQALALAEELGMRPLQAHCRRGLGTLYAMTGQREQARAALGAAIDLYRAMDMTFWLPQAEAALARVEGR
jgi:tetratricopeptide (TPR) repeat protein